MAAFGSGSLVHAAGVLHVEIDGEVVVYDPERGRAHLLSGTGSVLWPALSSPVTVDELAADVADVFEIGLADAVDQVRAFCAQLVDLGVLSVVDPPVAEA